MFIAENGCVVNRFTGLWVDGIVRCRLIIEVRLCLPALDDPLVAARVSQPHIMLLIYLQAFLGPIDVYHVCCAPQDHVGDVYLTEPYRAEVLLVGWVLAVHHLELLQVLLRLAVCIRAEIQLLLDVVLGFLCGVGQLPLKLKVHDQLEVDARVQISEVLDDILQLKLVLQADLPHVVRVFIRNAVLDLVCLEETRLGPAGED